MHGTYTLASQDCSVVGILQDNEDDLLRKGEQVERDRHLEHSARALQ